MGIANALEKNRTSQFWKSISVQTYREKHADEGVGCQRTREPYFLHNSDLHH